MLATDCPNFLPVEAGDDRAERQFEKPDRERDREREHDRERERERERSRNRERDEGRDRDRRKQRREDTAPYKSKRGTMNQTVSMTQLPQAEKCHTVPLPGVEKELGGGGMLLSLW